MQLMKSRFRALVTGIGLIAIGSPILAHHSFAVEYDPKKPVEGTGVISKVEWTNPHMRVYVDVTEPNGTVTTWNLELGAVNSGLRRGWKPTDLKTGARISVKGYGVRKVLARAAADALTLADGRSFTGASGAPDAPGK